METKSKESIKHVKKLSFNMMIKQALKNVRDAEKSKKVQA
jgi:hypothetical protein